MGIPESNSKNQFESLTVSSEKARIQIFDKEYEVEIVSDIESADFIIDLPLGKTILQADFVEGNDRYGVYYTYISKVD